MFTHRSNPQRSQTATQSPTKTGGSGKPTKSPKAKQGGLTKAAKIGIGVGVPLGVLAIAGAITAYILGKRRGRKRRVDDPTAGAGKLIKDPSPELSLPPPTPAVAELSTVKSDEFDGQNSSASSWWNPFGRPGTTKKKAYVAPPDAPQSPQEMPA